MVPIRFQTLRNYRKQDNSDLNQAELKANSDGSVEVYFGPKAPEGKEANWIPTKEGQRFFMLFRFYGATPVAYDGSYELNDIERVE